MLFRSSSVLLLLLSSNLSLFSDQITTKEVVNSKLGPTVRTDVESEVFRPSLNEPSDLLQPEHIEKVEHWNT